MVTAAGKTEVAGAVLEQQGEAGLRLPLSSLHSTALSYLRLLASEAAGVRSQCSIGESEFLPGVCQTEKSGKKERH